MQGSNKKQHSLRIKEALQQTEVPLGNPQAREQLAKINNQKKDRALMFAMMMQPIANHYRRKCVSQRKLVCLLNEHNICAPEGGRWVLSQLQKTLKRIDYLNILEILHCANLNINTVSHANYCSILNSPTLSHVPDDAMSEITYEMVKRIHQRIQRITNYNDMLISQLTKFQTVSELQASLRDDEKVYFNNQWLSLFALKALFLDHPEFGQHLCNQATPNPLMPPLTVLIAQIQTLSHYESD